MKKEEPIHFIIGVPTYNRSRLLQRLVDSVIQQSYTKWTLLFVNDGSEDDTSGCLADLSEKDSRIQYFDMGSNSGVNKARNKIIELSEEIDPEAFLLFIDDDDFLADQCLKNACQGILSKPGYHWYTLDCCYENGKPISRLKRYGELSYLHDYMFGKIMRGDMTHIIRVKCIEDIRFTCEFKNAEEWYFWCNLSNRMPLFAIKSTGSIKEYLPEGLTQSGMNRDKMMKVMEYKITSLRDLVPESYLDHQRITLAKLYLSTKDHIYSKKARSLLIQVLKRRPLYFRALKYMVVSLFY